MCAIIWRIMCAYGREACINACALRILEAETISSARVTLRMFCVDLILVLISRPMAMNVSGLGARDSGLGRCLVACGRAAFQFARSPGAGSTGIAVASPE